MLITRATQIIYPFLLVSSVDFMTPVTGATPTVQIGKPGAALAPATNAAVERGVGWYEVTLTTTETNTLGALRVDISAATAAPFRDISQVIAPGSGTGAIAFTYTVTDSATLLPIDGVQVIVTTDSAGANIVAQGVTNAFGQVLFYLDAGTYYFWNYRSGYSFSNPDSEVVS